MTKAVQQKRTRDPTLYELWGCRTVRPRVTITRAEQPAEQDDSEKVLVVDLFCGCGGFSVGASQAGHRVVLAVDCDDVALAYHRANHRACTHVRMKLGTHSEERLVALIRDHVPSAKKWHLHGSPPCQLFSSMRNVKKGKDHAAGMCLVEWYLDLVQRLRPDTWSFENVRSPAIRQIFEERGIAHGNFAFARYGVPQTRTRCLAGSAEMIKAFREDLMLRVDVPRTPQDCLNPPPEAALIRASGGKNVEYFYRRIDEPTWALLCACKPVYVAEDRSCVRVLTIRELLHLQTFPRSYKMDAHGCIRMLGCLLYTSPSPRDS